MQKGSREELIRRYLEGEMSVAEEHDFLIDAAVDRDLRLELSAQQTIDRALVKDRPRIDPEHYELLQQSVQGFLAATPHRRAFPSLRTGLIVGLMVLIGGLTVTLLPEGDDGATRPAERPGRVQGVDAETAPPTLPRPLEEGSIAVRSTPPEPQRPVDSPREWGRSISAAESREMPESPPDLPYLSSPQLPVPTATDDVESMVRIAPERRLDSMGEEELDSLRFNLKVEWDLPR